MNCKPLKVLPITAILLLTACGGGQSSTPANTSTSNPEVSVNTSEAITTHTVTSEKPSEISATIVSENNTSTLVWNHSSSQTSTATVYISQDHTINAENFALLDAEVISDAPKTLPLSNTSGTNQYVVVVIDYADNSTVVSDTLTLTSTTMAVEQAGSQLVKLDAEGKQLDASANTWDCVLDQVTGLVWQVTHEDQSTDYSSARYAWTEDGRDASPESRGLCGLHTPGKCSTSAVIERTQQQQSCGISSWRLPTISELHGLVAFDTSLPAINTDFFPDTQNGHYWAADTFIKNSDYAWNVSFDYGHAVTSPTNVNMDDVGYVRLVAKL